MRMFALAGLVAAVVAGPAAAQDAPKPQKEHEWLARFAGEWETSAELVTEPGKPPVTCKGTESARTLGGFWIVSEIKGEFMGTPMTGMMTVGYDPQKKKYVGTWVCSMDNTLWKYEGAVSGDVLTLETEGPDPMTGKTVKMRDVVEFKDKDTRVLTSSALGADGKWTTFMTMTAKRKK